MSQDSSHSRQQFAAPCIVDTGTIINKQDMQRLLSDLNRVRYIYLQDGIPCSQGEGCVLEIFTDPHQATLIANHALYINVCSFDYLELKQGTDQESWFDLIQEGRQLRLMPLSNPIQEQRVRDLNTAALEAVVAEVLAAGWDAQFDDEEHFSF